MTGTEIPTRDAPSADQPATPADVRLPGVSRGVRLAVLAGALAVFGIAGTVLWQAFSAKLTPQVSAPVGPASTEDAPITFADTEPSTVRLPVPDGPLSVAAIDQPVINEPAETPPDPSAQTVALIDAVRVDLERVRAALAPLEPALTALQTRVSTLEQTLETTQQKTTADQAAHAAIITALRTDFDALGGKVEALHKKPWRRRSPAARQPAPTLPFTAEAIDWWGDRPSLVVRTGGQRHFISPGEQLAGWRLAEVDRPGRIAVFERDGRRVRLGVSP